VAALDLRGRRVIQFTAGGMHALTACGHARVLLAASLVNATATAAYLRLLRPALVTLVTTGAWVDRDGDEDHACADLIAALLAGGDPPREPFATRVRNSDFGRRFAAGGEAHLPRADLDCCTQVDRFDFAMPLNRLHDGFAMRPVVAAGRGG
jgi:2-phosphosulfolactate phosphatase